MNCGVGQVADMARIQCGCGCGVGQQYSSDSAPSLGTVGCGPKKKKRQKKKNANDYMVRSSIHHIVFLHPEQFGEKIKPTSKTVSTILGHYEGQCCRLFSELGPAWAGAAPGVQSCRTCSLGVGCAQASLHVPLQICSYRPLLPPPSLSPGFSTGSSVWEVEVESGTGS